MMSEYIGTEGVTYLDNYLKENKFNKVLIFSGNSSFQNILKNTKLSECLRNLDYFNFSNIRPNPCVNDLNKGIDTIQKYEFDAIVAIGGGSVIDFAKIVSFFVAQQSSIEDFLVKKPEKIQALKPFIAIPTTSGTGSEATQFATFYSNKIKQSLDFPEVRPTCIIIDPAFTKDLPKHITASTGVDAFCQAVESYWSVKSTEESRNLAKQAILLIKESISKVVNDPCEGSREKIAKGAYLAGKAINITRTTACHAISYPMTSHFNIDHGQAVALTLTKIFEFNLCIDEKTCNDARGVKFVKDRLMDLIQILNCSNKEEMVNTVNQLFIDINLEPKLSNHGVKKNDFKIILDQGFTPSRMKNNPRLINKVDLENILNSIY
jgi:alcohol dehydrogenase class IV